MIVAVIALALVVVVLAHKSDPANVSTGAAPSNGTPITATQSQSTPVPPNNAINAFAATGVNSPYTGVGLPGANQQFKNLLFMQNPPGGPGSRYNAFVSSPKMKGTGLLDPLPDKGTRSKQLLTKDVMRRPGQKV